MKKPKTQLRHIVAVANHKGGVGKTTTTINLATAIHLRGYRVLVIDTDGQCTLSDNMGWRPIEDKSLQGRPTIYDALCGRGGIPVYKTESGLYLTPSSPNMNSIPVHNMDVENMILNEEEIFTMKELFKAPVDDHTGEGLTEWESAFDFIFIDTPPSLGRVTFNALSAADGLIIPVILQPAITDGYLKLINRLIVFRRKYNNDLRVHGVLINSKEGRRIRNAELLELDVRDMGSAFDTTIRRTVDIADALDNSCDERPTVCHNIFNYKRGRNKGSEDFVLLANEYLKKWA